MRNVIASQLEMPEQGPEGFHYLSSEPIFDPVRHLQIERPEHVYSLLDLGYSEQEVADCPSNLGVTSVFRLLSDEGAAAMLEVAQQLEQYTTSNARISRNVRGGVFRSRFLRDLCLSREVAEVVSELAGLKLLPHSLPHQLGHMNFNPLDLSENVDKWHVDTLRFDYVMFVTDPNSVEGGEFEYYKGTKHEVAQLAKDGKPLDPAKIVAPEMPGPGYVVLQQGNMVVHRAKGLRAAGRRITMVNGYVPADLSIPDYTRFDQLCFADGNEIAGAEYARHAAWMARERLQAQLQDISYSDSPERNAAIFEELAAEVSKIAVDLRNAGKGKLEHFGDG